jgi:hypothetical protein
MPLTPELNDPTSKLIDGIAYRSPDFTEIDYTYCYEHIDDYGKLLSYSRLVPPEEELLMTPEQKKDIKDSIKKMIVSGEIDIDEFVADPFKIKKEMAAFVWRREAYFAARGTTYEEFCKTHS